MQQEILKQYSSPKSQFHCKKTKMICSGFGIRQSVTSGNDLMTWLVRDLKRMEENVHRGWEKKCSQIIIL